MVVWLHCSIHIHKILCSNVSITIQGMTLDQPLTVNEGIFVHAPADFNETLPTETALCPSKRPKMVQVFIASFNLYQRFIPTLQTVI